MSAGKWESLEALRSREGRYGVRNKGISSTRLISRSKFKASGNSSSFASFVKLLMGRPLAG